MKSKQTVSDSILQSLRVLYSFFNILIVKCHVLVQIVSVLASNLQTSDKMLVYVENHNQVFLN